ncbi:MAG: diguanylate cyclase, partial [Deltaproteobacteria bacterium]|nr:diguanylate cyclase [Deltaproteobacteria bacterium]
RYVNFSTVAPTLHIGRANSDFSIEGQKKIQQFGQQQQALVADVEQIMARLNVALDGDMESNKDKSIHSIIVLAVLFLVVLLLVTVIVGRVAARLLVSPLVKLQRDFKSVERGIEIEEPPHARAGDEIGQLSSSFWALTQQLKQTTVSKHYVENIIRSMSGALVVLSSERTITKINTQAAQLFGYVESELIGRTLDFFLNSEDDAAKLEECFNEMTQVHELKDVEVFGVHSSGATFPAHFSGSAMYDDSGNLEGIICVFNDISAMKETENKLKILAHHDPLTGLPNRNLFFDRVEQALHDGLRHGRTFALLYLDLDNFKPLNDTLGHEVGDKALCEISSRLKNSLRADDTVARVGGDEFIIILNALNCADDARTLAQNVIEVITQPFVFGHLSHVLGVSVGISLFPNDGTSADTLIATADRAMYQAKENGGNAFYPQAD